MFRRIRFAFNALFRFSKKELDLISWIISYQDHFVYDNEDGSYTFEIDSGNASGGIQYA